MSHVVVRLGEARFALPMDAVAEVGRLPALTRVPGVPPWVAGVANWRGRVLGIIELRGLLGIPADADAGQSARLVLLQQGGAAVGVLTDRVDGVIEVDLETVDPPLLTLPEDARSLLIGQVTDDAGPIGVLDASAVFSLRGTLPGARRAG
ncbi:MAG: chemotaxis protein CheW [Mycobacteriales bacterium]|nr:chemotaxis protein CheW [Frankia sp.]